MHSRGPKRWPVERQRRALKRIVSREFQRSPEFNALIEQFGVFHAPTALAVAASMGYPMERDEAVNLMVAHLLQPTAEGSVAEHAAAAANPWAYLGACLSRWLRHEYGHRAASLREELDRPERSDHEDSPLTPIERVVTCTHGVLVPRTPERLHTSLWPLLQFLAMNPPQRQSYEHEERAWATALFEPFSEQQIAAVMNISWGGRPRRSSTSLMAQFLIDDEFVPETSPGHSRALSAYTRKMFALEREARALREWAPA